MSKRVTYTRADRVILAVMALMECDDFAELDTDGTARQDLDRAADIARGIRDGLPKPEDDAEDKVKWRKEWLGILPE